MKSVWFFIAALFSLLACGGSVVNQNERSPVDDKERLLAQAPSTASPEKEVLTLDSISSPLCVFDYDLTLSSHACAKTEGNPEYYCRTNRCGTYSWNDQCLGIAAREAVAQCVEQKAMIGIASHADRDGCWEDKVLPMVSQNQFPEWIDSPLYANTKSKIFYPAVDRKENWNCEACAYQMVPTISKPAAIERIMKFYGMDPDDSQDLARVIFWDDSPDNIDAVRRDMPEVKAIRVPRNNKSGNSGGCGITLEQISKAWND
jgi:hypothetical protein